MKSDFCIVGGGVSGLVAALILERYFPKKKINLIYSKHHLYIPNHQFNTLKSSFVYTNPSF